MKMVYFLFFLLVAIFGFCYQAYLTDQAPYNLIRMVPRHQAPNPCNQASYHHFVMVRTWPESFCLINNGQCVNAQNNFTLHGMWPAASNGQLVMNSNAKPPNTMHGWLNNNVFRILGYNNLGRFWPTLSRRGSNLTLWTYEWNKHGICSSSTLSASQYFQSAIAQKDKIDLLQALRAVPHHIIPNNSRKYSRSEIENAVSQWIGGPARAYVSCVFHQHTMRYIFVSIPIWHIISTLVHHQAYRASTGAMQTPYNEISYFPSINNVVGT